MMEIIRRCNNFPETKRLVEQKNALSRPGTLRRRYDHQIQRTICGPSRSNKKKPRRNCLNLCGAHEKSKSLGGGYQPIQEEPEESPEKGEIYQEPEDTEEHCIIMRGDNLPIVNLNKYNTDGKETEYIQMNHIVGNLTTNKEETEKKTSKRRNFNSCWN